MVGAEVDRHVIEVVFQCMLIVDHPDWNDDDDHHHHIMS